MKDLRFSAALIILFFTYLVPMKSEATCFFDQEGMTPFITQCNEQGGQVSTYFFPPMQLTLGCYLPSIGGTYYGNATPASCDQVEVPSPQSPGYPPGGPNNCQQGSIIMVEKKSVGETVNIIGTPYSMNYMSHKANRIMDRTATLSFISNATAYDRIRLNITIGNRNFSYIYTGEQITPGLKHVFNWDGLDDTGQKVIGSTNAQAAFVYYDEQGLEYFPKKSLFQLFYLRPLDFKRIGIAGWTLNIHHFYDATERIIYYGNGTDAFAPGQLNASEDTYRVFSEDGSEMYEFSVSTQRHLRTFFGTKGTVKYTFNYNSNGSLVSVVDYNNLLTSIQRDPVTDAPLSITGPYGHVTTLQTNSTGNLTRIQFGSFETHLMTYENDLLKSYRNPRGVVTHFSYDNIGRLVSDQSAAGSSVDLSFLNLDNGTSTTTTSAMGLVRNYSTSVISDTDSGIYSTQKTIPSMQPTEMSTNISLGKFVLSTYSDDLGGFNLSHYNSDPRTQHPFKSDSTYSFGQLHRSFIENRSVQFNSAENIFDVATYSRSFTDMSHVNGPQSSSLVYEGASSSYSYSSPLTRQAKVTVDNFERPMQYQFATDHPVSLTYDTFGRLSQISQSNRATLYRYSNLGYIANIRNALGQITRFTHDRSGKMTSQTGPDGRQILFTYDKNNNLTSVTPPGKSAHALTYNNFDLLSGYLTTNPTTWTYDNDRKISSIVRPDGSTALYNYNTTTARLTNITTPQGTYVINNNSDWNLVDSTLSPDNVQETFSYVAGRMTDLQILTPSALRWSRTLNNNFDTSTSQVQGGTLISYAYDNDSDLIQVGDLQITRSPTNGRTTRTQLQRIYENKNYSAFGELSSLKNRYLNTRIYQDYRFTRDRLGRISQKLETLEGSPQSTFNYVYDTSGRLTAVQKNGVSILSQVYDSNSNRIQVTENGNTINATYDDKDQILTWGALQFSHNLNGELIAITDSSHLPAGSTTFTYNVFGHLKSVSLPNGSQISYLLDAFNRRVGKRANNVLTKQFLWQDDLKIAAEYDGNGSLISEFIYAQSINAPDYMIKNGIKYKLVKDHLGSILAVVNAANGVIAQQLTYSTYGHVLSDSNPGFQPFGFAGGLYDPDTKLVRFGAREYNGLIGRWMTKDPILFNGGDTNLYGYVLADPINFTDSTGLDKDENSDAAQIGTILFNNLICPNIKNCTPLPLPNTPKGPDPKIPKVQDSPLLQPKLPPELDPLYHPQYKEPKC